MTSTITAKQDIAPATPPSGYVRLYAKTDGQYYFKSDDGVEHTLIGATGSTGAAGADGASFFDVRQTVSYGTVDSNGFANSVSAGAGLNFNVAATTTNLVVSFANGATDLRSTLTADATNQGTLKASNTNFIHATNVNASSVTWGQTLVPPDYAYAFDRTRGSLMNFEGTNGATTTTDDFGNTWTLTGATISTAQFKFGTASLDCTGGTAKYARTTNITTLGDGSWEISCWFRINALPGVSANAELITFQNASNFGARLLLNNAGGTIKLAVNLSSDGSTQNIANATLGANTTWNTAQWHKVRLVFDALAGTYKVYLSLNGAAETADISVSSSARICAITEAEFGRNVNAGANQFDGWFDACRFIRAATVTGTETPSASAPAIGDYPYHWFSIPAMAMNEVTSASATAGVNPGMTQRNRVFVAEADTNATTVTATRNYALRGQYVGPWTTPLPGLSAKVSANHNLGVKPFDPPLFAIEIITASNGFVVGDQWRGPMMNGTSAAIGTGELVRVDRNTVSFSTADQNIYFVAPGGGGAAAGIAVANAKFRFEVKRGW